MTPILNQLHPSPYRFSDLPRSGSTGLLTSASKSPPSMAVEYLSCIIHDNFGKLLEDLPRSQSSDLSKKTVCILRCFYHQGVSSWSVIQARGATPKLSFLTIKNANLLNKLGMESLCIFTVYCDDDHRLASDTFTDPLKKDR